MLKSNRQVQTHLIDDHLLNNTTLIYSQWSGYADGIWERDSVHHIHCSGHAKIETLEKLIRDVNLEDKDAFQSSFPEKLQ